MRQDRLPLTSRVQALLREGKTEEAKKQHARNLTEAQRKAEAGETINLSDLMASREEILLTPGSEAAGGIIVAKEAA